MRTHGASSYSAGCRCDECRAGHRERMRDYMRERRRKSQASERTCPGCGISFPMRGKRRWCTPDCKRRNEKPRTPLRARAERTIKRAAKGTVGDMVWIGEVNAAPSRTPRSVFYAQAKPLTLAYRAGDSAGVIAALLVTTEPVGACRIWTGRTDRNGYPRINIGGQTVAVHRVMAEAVHGPMHGQPVHHVCATRTCLAPAHLQPVSERENIAEMLERNWYIKRIAELEEALGALDPTHTLIANLRAA